MAVVSLVWLAVEVLVLLHALKPMIANNAKDIAVNLDLNIGTHLKNNLENL